MPKYIFVTGGVVSSVGKGITAAAIGRVMKSRGVSVTIQKVATNVSDSKPAAIELMGGNLRLRLMSLIEELDPILAQ